MLALAGYPLGLHFRFLDPSPEARVGRVATRITAKFTDRGALKKFAQGLALVSYEFENGTAETAQFLAERVPVLPAPAALEVAQDRLKEKQLFRKLGIATTEFTVVANRGALHSAVEQIGLPAVLKTCRMGYDGKGQWILRNAQDVSRAKDELPLERSAPAAKRAQARGLQHAAALIPERFVPSS